MTSAGKKETCRRCGGSGKCSTCDGRGYVIRERPAPIAIISGNVQGDSRASHRRTCSKCLGSGICQSCKGE